MGFVLYTARFPLIIRRFALASNIRVPTFPFCLIGLTNARAIFFLKPRSIYGVLFSPAYIHDSLLVHGSICTPSQLTTRYVSNVRDRYFFLERHNCEFGFVFYAVRRSTCRTDCVWTNLRARWLSHPSVFQHSEAYPRFSQMSAV